MKAIILPGGLGTRLHEETNSRPKPMVEIGGKPILWHIMKLYSYYGFNDFIILLGYKGYYIKEYFANYYMHNSDITIDELMQYITAPDFPTGGTIYGYQGVKAAFETGRGRVVVRATATIETDDKTGKQQIVITDIPYMVNKAAMIEKTADLVNEKKIEGIADIRDESDRDGLRIVYDIKRDAMPNVVCSPSIMAR